MTHRSLVIVSCILAGSWFVGCGRPATSTVLQREWTANAEFAGDVWASELGAQRGAPFEVREGSEVIDPIKLVRSGDVQFGVASSDRVLHENEGGAGLVILAAACFKSPVVFLAHEGSGIKTAEDFRGKTVGIQSGTNTDLVFRSLIAAHKLTPSDMKVVESGWGTTNFETRTLDVLAAFAYDEPVQLDLKKVPYTTIQPEESGVKFVGTVYFTSESLAKNQPETVQAFMNNLVAGWREALRDSKGAIERLGRKFSAIDKNKEALSFERGRQFFAGEDGRLLYASRERWEEMGRNLVQLQQLKQFDFGANVDYRFLDAALQSLGSQK